MNKSVRRFLCLLLSALTVGSFTVSCGGGGGDTPPTSSSSESSSSSEQISSSESSSSSEQVSSSESSSSSEQVSSSESSSSSEQVSSSESSSSSEEDGKEEYDPNSKSETRPIVFSTEALDGNFNPFFATSATDVEILSMTQISMLGVTAEGNVACGQDQPTVVDSYTINTDADNRFTDYSFVIKNGIKFSDGSPLTIEDVLFNLYVYLDPAYMGSATIYSTDIVGLKAYKAQDPDLLINDAGFDQGALNKIFYDEADIRIQNIIDSRDKDSGFTPNEDELKNINEDIARLKELFWEEVNSDWSNNAGTQTSYEQEYTLKENWEIYFFVEGLASTIYYKTQNGSKALKDENGKYVTTLTKPGVILEDGTEYDGSYQGQTYYASHIVEEIEAAASDEDAIAAKMAAQGCTREAAIAYVIQDKAINMVYETYTADAYLEQILLWWASGSNLREELMAKARTAYYEKELANGMKVETISGITTSKTQDGKNDVLNIRINGIDPKAIWNFGFTVSPKYYYSNSDAIENTKFGVKWNDFDFFNNVLKAPEKNGLPVGAGIYQATDKYGNDNVSKENFYINNFVYFKRNNYFETVGSGLCNAKIKYLRYKVVNSDQIVQAMQMGEIDIGEPNATAANIKAIAAAGLNYKTSPTNGYGYVGINPTYVPDLEVRQAIMYAMNTEHTLGYYTGDLAELVFRSMSRASWAYPSGDAGETPYYDTSLATKDFIQDLVGQAGWEVGSGGKLYKDGKMLEVTFTIAGATQDHPAYNMFLDAEKTLEDAGFTITVKNDASALKKLATGGLAVWAAAWSSTVDPDMYQVYHKDSNATSTKNWGYNTILNDQTGDFAEEQDIIEQLSERIDAARETMIQSERAAIYAEALDLVMDLAVELPTYQRNDCVAYNPALIDYSTLNQNPTAYAGVIDKLWELDYVD